MSKTHMESIANIVKCGRVRVDTLIHQPNALSRYIYIHILNVEKDGPLIIFQ